MKGKKGGGVEKADVERRVTTEEEDYSSEARGGLTRGQSLGISEGPAWGGVGGDLGT